MASISNLVSPSHLLPLQIKIPKSPNPGPNPRKIIQKMENQKRVVCPENEDLAQFMMQKRQELADSRRGLSENLDKTLSKAYDGVCCSKEPIQTLKDLSQIKGVGKWMLKQMQGFFDDGSGSSEPQEAAKKGRGGKGMKRYVPQKNSVSYALLITLYRGTSSGNEFMRKQELIDAAEASGLSRMPIVPEKGKGKPAAFGSSPKDWYSGWRCMKTLITKGLVVKSSCPAKYMLTEEGQEVARECLMRSHWVDPRDNLANVDGSSNLVVQKKCNLLSSRSDAPEEASVSLSSLKKPIDVPPESLERLMRMGYSKEQVLQAFAEVSETYHEKETSSLWLAVLCCLREDQVYNVHSEPKVLRKDFLATSTTNKLSSDQVKVVGTGSTQNTNSDSGNKPNFYSSRSAPGSLTLRACYSLDHRIENENMCGLEATMNVLSMPPLGFGERFQDVYEVILILDDREQFAVQGSKGRKLIDIICKEYQIKIQVRRLPVGDGIWIACHKYLGSEYVLDFIVERKKIDDLRSSIRDNRYKDQKLRLLRCGLRKLIYLVEGDPNSSEAAESIKTACFTTEILEGFNVQRTSSLGDTMRKYGNLTQSIIEYYRSPPAKDSKFTEVCPAFDEFIKRCQDLEKLTVTDVFAIQLMQVPQVTEEVAIAVVDLYPTLSSLARAYSLLEGDVCAQEEMLRKQSNNVISGPASRNIFHLVWGNDQ